MTKSEVCSLLGISEKTLQRRMLKGVYKFTRHGDGQYAPVSFTMTDIGLPEPPAPVVAAPAPVVTDAPVLEPIVTKPTRLSEIELQRQKDEVFADLFKRGEAADSTGNKVDGSNKRWPNKPVSLLGPTNDLDFSGPKETQSHMQPELLGTWNGPLASMSEEDIAAGRKLGEPLLEGRGTTRSGAPLAAGYSQDQYNADMNSWRRHCGNRPSMGAEMENSINAINSAFPQAQTPARKTGVR
jgi:hypothetical protein